MLKGLKEDMRKAYQKKLIERNEFDKRAIHSLSLYLEIKPNFIKRSPTGMVG